MTSAMSDECMEPIMEPTWLDTYRAGQDIRVFPEPSRDWMDDRLTLLTRDVAFNRHSMNDGHHVSPTDNGMVQIGTDGIKVALAQGIDEEAFKKTLTAATRATIGLDMTQTLPGDWEHCQEFCDVWKNKRGGIITKQESDAFTCGHSKHEYNSTYQGESHYRGQKPMEDWEEMLKGGLQTALETQTIVFAVGGASRTATHQLVRSRRASFHQQSQRAGYMGDAPEIRMPESIWRDIPSRDAFLRATMESWKAYKFICDRDISYQDARFILGEGTTNFILLEYPVREFLNVFAYRGCSMFQWEIVHIMREARRVLVEAHPWIEPYVKISCEKTGPAVIKIGSWSTNGPDREEVTVPHHCTFQGWEDVEGQCDFPWAKQEARTFKPEFHRITKEK